MDDTSAARTERGFMVALGDVPAALTGGTVAIGNFDGVHRGHQAVLAAALEGPAPALALTFEPHPRDFFGGAPVARLTPQPVKARVMEAFGLGAMVVARFDAAFASLSADAFADEIVAGALGARQVVVGYDFNYGAKRMGNARTLTARGASCGFGVRVVDGFADAEGFVVSSSRVRRHLAAGELAAAQALLGYRYTVIADVVHGEKRGRTMGYPTANQTLGEACPLRHGIYAVRVLIDGVWRDGVASYGRRPTFDDGAPLLETFVFDYEGELYGRSMTVTFVAFLRQELRFDGIDALVRQMDADSTKARAALSGLAPLSPLDAKLNF